MVKSAEPVEKSLYYSAHITGSAFKSDLYYFITLMFKTAIAKCHKYDFSLHVASK